MNPLLILGASHHGAVVAEAASFRWKVVGYVDSTDNVDRLTQSPLVGCSSDLPRLLAEHGVADLFVAIGDNHVRKIAMEHARALAPNLRFPPLVHLSATVCQGAEIGEGAIVCAGAVIGVGAKVGAFSIVNTGASLDHHSALGDFASMAPASATGGNAVIGEGAAIGMGVMIHHGKRVGAWSVVGSSSLVNRDLPAHVVAYGQPAKVIRPRPPGEKYL